MYSRKGSPLDEKQTLLRSELLFDPYITIGEILDAFYNFRNRINWDENLLSGEVIERLSPSLQIVHSTNKKISFISSRDFVEKRLSFAHDGKFFIYFSACKDEIQPPEQTVVRGE